ncbi:MAG TPA: hypothetical protein VNK46_01405 [Nitrospiraceae bacterium]|jgi:hypothetical protein|nr:hypothetical protein [Nitrospiraceae bacterium]
MTERRRGLAGSGPFRAALAVWLALSVAGAVLSGCGPSKVTVKASPDLEKYRVQTIAVVPFDALTTPQVVDPLEPRFQVPAGAKASDISVAVPPASETASRPTSVVPSSAPEKVTRMIWNRLRARKGLLILPLDEADKVAKELSGKHENLSREALAQRLADRMSADAALVGRVLVYKERVGSRLGADPAAVGFEMKLVARDGTVLWEGNYYEKQRPMNEDLIGFIQRKGAFVTADELAAYGADLVLRDFPFGTAS